MAIIGTKFPGRGVAVPISGGLTVPLGVVLHGAREEGIGKVRKILHLVRKGFTTNAIFINGILIVFSLICGLLLGIFRAFLVSRVCLESCCLSTMWQSFRMVGICIM